MSAQPGRMDRDVVRHESSLLYRWLLKTSPDFAVRVQILTGVTATMEALISIVQQLDAISLRLDRIEKQSR